MGATTFCVSSNALYFFYEVIILDKGVHCSRGHLSANTGFIFDFFCNLLHLFRSVCFIHFYLCASFILISNQFLYASIFVQVALELKHHTTIQTKAPMLLHNINKSIGCRPRSVSISKKRYRGTNNKEKIT